MSNNIVVLVNVTRLLQFMPLACKFWVGGFHSSAWHTAGTQGIYVNINGAITGAPGGLG